MSQSAWNFATLWEAIADRAPRAPAQAWAGSRWTWADFDRRAEALGDALASATEPGDKVALYLHNGAEYLEAAFACFKAGLVPVNTNYRYRRDELVHLWTNADVSVVIFDSAYTGTVAALRSDVPGVREWYRVGATDAAAIGAETTGWAVPYEEAAARDVGERSLLGRRGPDDLVLFYTGGTTGMPKGVMWRQDDLLRAELSLDDASFASRPADPDLLGVPARGSGVRCLPASPLMHGTGFFTAVGQLSRGGCVVTMAGRRFDAAELLGTVEREAITHLTIVGDAFARPMVAALEATPGRWDLRSLTHVFSSGAIWSEDVKRRLLAHVPAATIVDSLGSSEAFGMGRATTTADGTTTTARFRIGPTARVVGDDGQDVEPGSGRAGRLAVSGFIPLGYYKDKERSARTFPVIDGIRHAMPGDFATVDADGDIALLGRGSGCINTGGEKVYAEEVEQVIVELPDVTDCAVVGVPDPRFGEVVAVLVEPAPDASVDEQRIVDHVKRRLASYKAPRVVLPVDSVERAPNGKLDHRRLRRRAAELAGARPSVGDR